MKCLLLLILLNFGCQQKNITTGTNGSEKESFAITITQVPEKEVTDAIKKVIMEDSVSDDRYKRNFSIERGAKKIIATTYFSLSDSRQYTASAEIKNDTIILVVNTTRMGSEDTGKDKYYKLEAVIDNPKNIHYPVIADQAFTFLEKGETLKTFTKSFIIGDIDGDKKPNTAITEYEKVVAANGEETNDCGRTDCSVTAKFGKGIPDITIWRCYSMAL